MHKNINYSSEKKKKLIIKVVKDVLKNDPCEDTIFLYIYMGGF
jgi:hypothetical protein